MSDTALGTQIVSWLSLALVVCGIVVGAVNHKRIKSSCCRHEATVSLDIDNTTPKGDKVEALKSSSPEEKKEPSS
jgi:hypothetical protein